MVVGREPVARPDERLRNAHGGENRSGNRANATQPGSAGEWRRFLLCSRLPRSLRRPTADLYARPPARLKNNSAQQPLRGVSARPPSASSELGCARVRREPREAPDLRKGRALSADAGPDCRTLARKRLNPGEPESPGSLSSSAPWPRDSNRLSHALRSSSAPMALRLSGRSGLMQMWTTSVRRCSRGAHCARGRRSLVELAQRNDREPRSAQRVKRACGAMADAHDRRCSC